MPSQKCYSKKYSPNFLNMHSISGVYISLGVFMRNKTLDGREKVIDAKDMTNEKMILCITGIGGVIVIVPFMLCYDICIPTATPCVLFQSFFPLSTPSQPLHLWCSPKTSYRTFLCPPIRPILSSLLYFCPRCSHFY